MALARVLSILRFLSCDERVGTPGLDMSYIPSAFLVLLTGSWSSLIFRTMSHCTPAFRAAGRRWSATRMSGDSGTRPPPSGKGYQVPLAPWTRPSSPGALSPEELIGNALHQGDAFHIPISCVLA